MVGFVVWNDHVAPGHEWEEFNQIINDPVTGPEIKGQRQIYPMVTQIGTAANRTFRDRQGRIIKTIYYTAATPRNLPAQGPEGMSDADFEKFFKLQRTQTNQFDWNGFYRVEVSTGFDQRKDQVALYLNESNQRSTQIWYDPTGTHIIGIHGLLPGFLSEKLAWSAFGDGVRASFFVITYNGTIGGRSVFYTIHNTGNRSVKFTDFSMQLIGLEGREFPVDAESRARHVQARGGRPVWGIGEEIRPGDTYSSSQYVADWFGASVPVGEYQLRIKIQVDHAAEFLEFTALDWNITEPWNGTATAPATPTFP